MDAPAVPRIKSKRLVPTAKDKELWYSIKREVEKEQEKVAVQPRARESTAEGDHEYIEHLVSNYRKCREAIRRRLPSRACFERTLDILGGDNHEWEVRQAAAEGLVSWRRQQHYLSQQEIEITKQRLHVIYRERERARLLEAGWTMLGVLHPTYISEGIGCIKADR